MFRKIDLRQPQRGQAAVLVVLAIVGLLGMTALAIDAANTYSDRRHAQSSTDNAALAGALAYVNTRNVTAAALQITRLGGFPDGSVTVQNPPGPDCSGITPDPVDHFNPYDNVNYYVQVIIRTTTEAVFGPTIGVTELKSCVSAIARAKPELIVPPFNGNAVVGLDPNGKSFHAHSNAQEWHIRGGGLFANNNAEDDHANVEFPDGDCATAVGTTTGFAGNVCTHPGSVDQEYIYPDDITPLLPPIPDCDGTAFVDSDDRIHPEEGHEVSGSVWADGFSGDSVDFAPGVYCLPDLDGNIHDQVQGTSVTFFVTDTDFTMKYNGGGSFGASAPMAGKYKGVLIFSAITPEPCTQNIDIRGNGSTPIVGTVFMPSACIDWRGNGTGNADRSQIIGYDVTSNGNADVSVYYNPEDGWKAPEPPMVELTR